MHFEELLASPFLVLGNAFQWVGMVAGEWGYVSKCSGGVGALTHLRLVLDSVNWDLFQ